MPDEVTITVGKSRLVETLRKNRDRHRDEFERTYEEFRKRYVQNVQDMLKEGKRRRRSGELKLYVDLRPPKDHTDDYERALEMLDWHRGDTVELTTSQFTQFIQDDWGWRGEFETSKSSYGIR